MFFWKQKKTRSFQEWSLSLAIVATALLLANLFYFSNSLMATISIESIIGKWNKNHNITLPDKK